ncbi:hypothetical protein [Pedosphaera parvula]|uniref:Uncharacterized protein n=1 Tax=Pedosphaera parvula (strain Ellin514) TaxID=320771 RepID=B9XFS5_PEDPL|nr:hypothetical protein [Pedosphaera parvula]EEF61439.1 hypothetical protein Cflav_PD4460 [Pedosphaera parvula Ellin514]
MLFTVALVVAIGWLVTREPKPVPTWSLPDGSVMSLAGVTYGAKHKLRYDNRWQDYAAALLPSKWQAGLGSRIASHRPSGSNAVVVWLWQDNTAKNSTIPGMSVYLATADDNGLEGQVQYGPDDSYSLPNGKTLTGWELRQIPRTSKEIGVRIYRTLGSHLEPVGEFKIPNKSRKPGVAWKAEALPATRKTNELEVTLVRLKTGLTGLEAGIGKEKNAKAYTLAVFELKDKGEVTKKWQVTGIEAVSPNGEFREGESSNSSWKGQQQYYFFPGALWLDEPAWKLKVQVTRSEDYPAEELWTIKGVPVPGEKGIVKFQAQTNIYGAEIGFQGVSAAGAKVPEDWIEFPRETGLHVVAPSSMSDTHLKLIEVKDDQGRKVEVRGVFSVGSTGGRGATLREINYAFGVQIPKDAKSLDVTFAFTKSWEVEFLAEPVMGD